MHGYTELSLAKEAADSVGIRLHVIDARESFDEIVVSNFIKEYKNGRTPNPCIICNSEVKFRALLDFARANGFDKIATGHYAKIVTTPTPCGVKHTLANANDSKKDQTYMLWQLSEDILANLLLPLGDEQKEDVRKITRDGGIKAADRGESQEICFIPSGDYAEYIENRTGKSECGSFIDENGNILGEHKGIIRYTIGQRKGLGVAVGQRIFVTNIDVKNNTITLSTNDVKRDKLTVSGMRFLAMPELSVGESIELSVKLRYAAPKVRAVVTYLGQGRAEIALSTPVRAITPGQSAVFYDGEVLIAGAFID